MWPSGIPDSYMGNFWRARTNSVIDHLSTAGLAKPYYEKAIELIDPEKNPKQLLEAYRYMAYYYYLQEDRDNSLKYCDLILGYGSGRCDGDRHIQQSETVTTGSLM